MGWVSSDISFEGIFEHIVHGMAVNRPRDHWHEITNRFIGASCAQISRIRRSWIVGVGRIVSDDSGRRCVLEDVSAAY